MADIKKKGRKTADSVTDDAIKDDAGKKGLKGFFSGMDPQKKRVTMKVAGLVIAAFSLFTLLSVVSYLFTWKADQSLLADPQMIDADVDVNNIAGKWGYKWSYFLVTRCFGLGSFALVILLAIVAAKLFYAKDGSGYARTLLVTVSGAFVFSLLFAYFSDITGLVAVLGSGLGGDCGDILIAGMNNLTGSVITFVIILILLVSWLLLASGRFALWFARLGEKKPVDGSESADEASDGAEDDVSVESAEDVSDAGGQDAHNGGDAGTGLSDDVVSDEDSDGDAEGIVSEPGAKTGSGRTLPLAAGSETGTKIEQEDGDGPLEVIAGDGFSSDVKKELPRIDNREELENFQFPPLDLLEDYSSGRHEVASEELERNNNKIRATLLSYKIQVERVTACVGPTVTLYKVVPAPGVKIAAIKNLDQDIAMSLSAKGVRVVRLSDSVGIEVANDRPSIVPLKSMLNDDAFRNSKAELPVAIGYTITQKVKVFDLADAPHLLVAGATKQGKSVGLNVIVTSLLYAKHPSELKFVFIDPKMVEFTAYARLLKHYLAVLPDAADENEEMDKAIVKQPKQAEEILRSLCIEMDERYALFSKAVVNNLKLYNDKYKDRHLLPTEGHRFMPYIVVVIDEYADLIMSGSMGGESKNMARSITTSIIRLAQKGRAAGIHVIIATQRPSVDVITGLIKTNFPTRIAFRVSTRVDSSTILDSPGAERLIGKGDMLYYAGVESERVQCALIGLNETSAVTGYIAGQTGYKKCYNTPYYLPAVNDSGDSSGPGMIDMQNVDAMFEEAARLVVSNQQGSTSALQRKLGLGYARAGKVMDQLEAAGIVGPQEGSKPRQVLIADLASLEPVLQAFLGQ